MAMKGVLSMRRNTVFHRYECGARRNASSRVSVRRNGLCRSPLDVERLEERLALTPSPLSIVSLLRVDQGQDFGLIFVSYDTILFDGTGQPYGPHEGVAPVQRVVGEALPISNTLPQPGPLGTLPLKTTDMSFQQFANELSETQLHGISNGHLPSLLLS